jgi:hypothetical protein
MSCALTAGYTLDCRDSMGGLKEIYLIELSGITSFAEASGVVTGITKASGKKFHKFEQLPQTAQATEEITGSDENGTIFYAQTIELFLNKMQASIRNQVKLLGQNRLVAVTVDRNGKAFMYGAVLGLALNSGSGTSGKAYGDRNGYGLTLTGAEREPAFEVNAATLATLTTPG